MYPTRVTMETRIYETDPLAPKQRKQNLHNRYGRASKKVSANSEANFEKRNKKKKRKKKRRS